jgi:hypothetical protein
VIDSLSLNRFASGPELELSSLSVTGGSQVVPPFRDRLVTTALCAVERSNEMLIAWRVPEPFSGLGDHESHGSDDRSYWVLPVHLLSGGLVIDQLVPPLRDTPATRPCAPPSDHRSCCQKPTRFMEFCGLTSNHGSTSVFGKLTPATSLGEWKPSPGPPHPAVSGLAPLAAVGPVVE